MKLYIYKGLENEKVPESVTHVIVASSVTIIKKMAFYECEHLVSVIMGDNIKGIEDFAFYGCRVLRFIRLSRVLECIGEFAFQFCHSLEALFLPSTFKSIGEGACLHCRSLRLLILPNNIDLNNVGKDIIYSTGIHQSAKNAGVAYEWVDEDVTVESSRRVNEWLFHHMDEAPFHELCYNPSITTEEINHHINEHGNDAALAIDTIHGMTPLHMLTMNPHTPADAILALLKANINAANMGDNKGKKPLYYAWYYNPCAFVRMYSYLLEHGVAIENEIQSLLVNPNDHDIGSSSTPLHDLAGNPFVPADNIAALLELKMEAAFCPDNEGMTPLDCAKEYNVDGLVSMITVLCNHRNSMALVENKAVVNSKKRKIQD